MDIDASNAQLVTYLVVSNFTLYTYAWLSCISEEVEIVSRGGLSWSIVVYFLSRICEHGHMILEMVFALAPEGGCEALGTMLAVLAIASIACTAFLFFLRVRAVYLQARYITVIFGTLWLVTAAVNVFDGTTRHPECIAYTKHCNINTVAYYALPSISTSLNDTLIFLAISYRLAADQVALSKGWRSRLLLIARGKGLYPISRSLMQSGFLYYLAMISFLLSIVTVSPLIPAAARRYLLVTGYISFANIMACAAFRHVALSNMQAFPTGLTSTRIAAALHMVT